MVNSRLLASACLSLALRAVAQVTVTVNATASHPIPTTLWGQMYESGDGGLYAELLQNRAFQKVTPGSDDSLTAWGTVGSGNISVIADDQPVSSSLPNSLELVVPDGATGAVGFSNEGYWGIKVTESTTYNASFYYKVPEESNFSGDATIALQSSSGDVLASATIPISGAQTEWTQVAAELTPSSSAGDVNNVFTVTLDGEAAAGLTVDFALFSLFPPTFKDRPNGLRPDIAQALVDMGPSFFRLPGGNNLEGNSIATRWKWNETVGSLLDRPGRPGTWGYINTDGLGIYEYLLWCEDAGMEPIMGVFAGYALDKTSVPEDQLQPYIQEAIDQIHFAVSDASANDAAALRASLGHPEPFNIRYIEIGNEDWISSQATETYGAYRWNAYATALKAEFPDLQFIATSLVSGPTLDPTPTSYDVHDYRSPSWYQEQRNGTTYFEGEYSCQTDRNGDRWAYPSVLSAISEGAYMTGLERNSDIVFAAAYAPVLNHVNATDWVCRVFVAGNVYLSTSYYVQQLFAHNRGDEYLPSTLPERNGTLYWSVARNDSAVIIKVANLATDAANLTFQLPFDSVAESGVLTYITGSETDENTPEQPDLVVPQTSTVETGATFNYTAPGSSFGVLVVGV
ncbi:glycoside hydrolase [Schizophyllum commune Loenen D]|nr:glycoside hydrolase [Schizophyllum commune Loenen D]